MPTLCIALMQSLRGRRVCGPFTSVWREVPETKHNPIFGEPEKGFQSKACTEKVGRTDDFGEPDLCLGRSFVLPIGRRPSSHGSARPTSRENSRRG